MGYSISICVNDASCIKWQAYKCVRLGSSSVFFFWTENILNSLKELEEWIAIGKDFHYSSKFTAHRTISAPDVSMVSAVNYGLCSLVDPMQGLCSYNNW